MPEDRKINEKNSLPRKFMLDYAELLQPAAEVAQRTQHNALLLTCLSDII